ncbi:MAG: hypothetical protein LBK95_16680 [Bifidobacteriaceae bacterium]|jgi:hypothetical protein|nr:hypothetical protein [Bifidobacteriaceae bacterium]
MRGNDRPGAIPGYLNKAELRGHPLDRTPAARLRFAWIQALGALMFGWACWRTIAEPEFWTDINQRWRLPFELLARWTGDAAGPLFSVLTGAFAVAGAWLALNGLAPVRGPVGLRAQRGVARLVLSRPWPWVLPGAFAGLAVAAFFGGAAVAAGLRGYWFVTLGGAALAVCITVPVATVLLDPKASYSIWLGPEGIEVRIGLERLALRWEAVGAIEAIPDKEIVVVWPKAAEDLVRMFYWTARFARPRPVDPRPLGVMTSQLPLDAERLARFLDQCCQEPAVCASLGSADSLATAQCLREATRADERTLPRRYRRPAASALWARPHELPVERNLGRPRRRRSTG